MFVSVELCVTDCFQELLNKHKKKTHLLLLEIIQFCFSLKDSCMCV